MLRVSSIFCFFFFCVCLIIELFEINLLHSRAILLRGRTGCCQRVCRNRNIWSIQGGNAFQLRLDNPKIDRKQNEFEYKVQVFYLDDILTRWNLRLWFCCCICCSLARWNVRNSIRSRAVPSLLRNRYPVTVDDIAYSRRQSDRGTKFVPEPWWTVPWTIYNDITYHPHFFLSVFFLFKGLML